MSMIPIEKKDYSDGRTKQSFKDSTDINKIVAKWQKTGTISHLAKHQPVYGDFSDIDDLLSAHNRMVRGVEIFNELPSEVRKEFNQDIGEFFRYVNDPANKDDLAEKLPALAKPGRQHRILDPKIQVQLKDELVAAVGGGSSSETSVIDSPVPESGSGGTEPSGGSGSGSAA